MKKLTQGETVVGVLWVLLFILVIVGSALLEAWALTVIWDWCLAGVAGLPVLSMRAAVGVTLVCGLVQILPQPSNDDSRTLYEKTGAALARLFLKPLAVLAMAWLLLQFVT